MKIKFLKTISAFVAAATLTAGFPVNTFAASLLPVAGVARVLSEGKSATGVRADRIKIQAKENDEIIAVSSISDEEQHGLDMKTSSIKETAKTSEPAVITVGEASATSSETISENVVLSESANLEVSEEEEQEAPAELVEIEPEEKEIPEEDEYENLVIAKVNDYVNVRKEPSEESEIVGKLYNKSAGELLEEAGDWYKIHSGSCTGYVKGEFVVTGEAAKELAKEVGTRMAVVTTTTLYVREEPSTDSDVIGMVPIDDELTVSEELPNWAKVSVEEGEGYVSREFVRLYTYFVKAESKEEEERRLAREAAERKAAQEAARKAAAKNKKNTSGGKSASGGKGSGASYAVTGSGNGGSVASYALQFVGNPYVYGGSSLTNGTDCSGFVMSVYRNFGVSLPHSSGGDRGVGYDVGGLGNAQAGDIVCYSGHVGIYIGGGQIVHASTPSSGIKVSNANYRPVLAVRRIF